MPSDSEVIEKLVAERDQALEALQLAREIILDAMRSHCIYPSVGNFKFIEQTLNRLKGNRS